MALNASKRPIRAAQESFLGPGRLRGWKMLFVVGSTVLNECEPQRGWKGKSECQ